MIRFDVLTLFPEMFESFLKTSIIGRAVSSGLLEIRLHNIRDYASGRHKVTDDVPYGGGSGMVMKPEPLVRAVQALEPCREAGESVILLSPQGTPFRHERAQYFATLRRLILVCGRYEGVDERVKELAIDEEVSIGDYVLTGGELAAMVVIDATARLVPGVLGDGYSSVEESFAQGLLEYPQYTRPREFMGRRVPAVLLSGDHKKIAQWRRRKALECTLAKRPDLLERAALSEEERALVDTSRRASRTLGDQADQHEESKYPGCEGSRGRIET